MTPSVVTFLPIQPELTPDSTTRGPEKGVKHVVNLSPYRGPLRILVVVYPGPFLDGVKWNPVCRGKCRRCGASSVRTRLYPDSDYSQG